ncbi:MAG: oligopeptide transporter, OPT family [Phycisphaerales bacterium]|nr:MAG: oligopeptide transporter, OPT family [Phycisphaerales bacterium]
MRELSWLAVLLGVVIGALLAAANAFVGLKVGMTITASIPAAVMALLILRTLLKRGTLLEGNMVQTVGSAGESAAAGMIFTIPALFIMGENPAYLEMIIWGGIGGLLGVCFMVPLRYVLIVREHGVLPYPEGVACAEVLESGERGGAGAKSVIWGAIVGGVYYLLNGLGFWNDTGRIAIRRFRTEAQLDSSPALLGIGYILGPRIAGYMLSGALLAWFVLIPAIAFFGADVEQPIFPETAKSIAQMKPVDIWEGYIRYIGAGAVAVGGLISLFKSLPTIVSAFWRVLGSIIRTPRSSRDRTARDFPSSLLILIIAGLAYAMWRFEQVKLDHIGVIAVVVFTFFFVTVSSRLVGLVGSSSNPVSGMTIATLLATALGYKFFVMDRAAEVSGADLTALKITCLSVGAIVSVAISIAGDTSQDLKTGFLLKATPYKQQIGEMLGVITSVLVIAGLLLLLNKAYGFVETPEKPHPLPAFQANIMKIIVEGVLGGQVPWTLILMGGAAAVVVEMLGLPALPFAVGMYLPLGLSSPIMVGGIIRWIIDRRRRQQTKHDPGVLTASGLVAGKGLMGVALAGVTALIAWAWKDPRWINTFAEDGPQTEAVSPAHLVPWVWERFGGMPAGEQTSIAYWWLPQAWWDALPMFPFVLLVMWLWWCARRRPPVTPPAAASATVEPPERDLLTPVTFPEEPGVPQDPPGEAVLIPPPGMVDDVSDDLVKGDAATAELSSGPNVAPGDEPASSWPGARGIGETEDRDARHSPSDNTSV